MRRPYALGDTRAVPAYCRSVIIAAVLAGVIVLMAAALTWTAHLVHIGNLNMQALADKLATPEPVSALDWPELRVHAVIPEPGEQPLVLVQVGWPAHPRQRRPCYWLSTMATNGLCRCWRSGALCSRRSHRSVRRVRNWNCAAARAWNGCTPSWSRSSPWPRLMASRPPGPRC